MFDIYQEKDKVKIDLRSRRDTIYLNCDEALQFADALDQMAVLAEREPAELFRGEPWECKVESWDGGVYLRFVSPQPGHPQVVILPARIARQMAVMVRNKEGFARHNMTLVLQRG